MKRMSKSLLCGVIATSFLLLNCQKAPNRPVTADPGAGQQGKPADPAATMGKCTDDVLKLIKDQITLLDAIDALSKTDPATDTIKATITTKAGELKTVSDSLYGAIKAIKVDSKPGIGCNEEMPAVDGKPIQATPHTLAQLKEKQTGVIARASGVTGTQLPGSPEPSVIADSSLILNGDLAEAFSDDKNISDLSKNKIGLKFIQDGALKESANDGSEYKKAADDKTKPSCLITVGNSAAGIDSGAEAKVSAVVLKIDAASKRNQLFVSFSVADDTSTAAAPKAPIMLGITCNISDGAEDAAVDVRKALGSLVSDKKATQPSAPASGDPSGPASGDPTLPPVTPPASGDPTLPPVTPPASGDPTLPPVTPPASGDPTLPPVTSPASGDPTLPPVTPPASGDPTTPPPADQAAQARHDALLAAQRAQAASQAMTILTRSQRAQ